jgi:hypothetical protein
VVDECPPQNFNPPLIERDAPLLVQVRKIFSAPFSLFIHPPTMSGTHVSSSVVEATSPSSSGTGGNPLESIPMMSTLPPLSFIGPTPSKPFYFDSLIWGMPVMSSSPFVSLPSVYTPIPSILIPTFRSSSSGGLSFGFIMGGGIPSTSTIPMSGPVFSRTSSPFEWNMSSGFGVVPSQSGGNNTSGVFNFPWVRTPFLGGTSLGGNFSPWGGFPFVTTSSLGGFFPGTDFRNVFPGGSTFTPEGIFGSRSSHDLGGDTIPVGTSSSGSPQPYSSNNIGGPQSPYGTTETSPPSQYSFSLLPFLAMLDLLDSSLMVLIKLVDG